MTGSTSATDLVPQPKISNPPPAPPPLHSDDQEVLDRFRAEEKERDEAIDACKAAAAEEKRRLDAEAKDLAEEQARIKTETAQLDKDKKALTPEEATAKKSELQERSKKLAKDKSANARKMSEAVRKRCPSPLPKSRNCVPPDPAKAMGNPLAGLEADFNKANGTKIDFASLVRQEAAYSGAYVPWWPVEKTAKDISLTTKHARTDDPAGKIKVIRGNSSSGVTIGVGVDLGPQRKSVFLNDLDAINKKYQKLSPNQLQSLKDKIDPYLGRMRAEACSYLSKNPLDLTDSQLEVLHLRALDTAIATINNTPSVNIKSLDAAAQTKKFKEVYNEGH